MIRKFFICSVFNLSMFLVSAKKDGKILEYSEILMGTDVRILVDSEETKRLKNAVQSAYMEGHRLNKIFSDWDAQSETSRFSMSSMHRQSFSLSQELWEVLSFSQKLSQRSKGAFDVTIGPLSRLWRIARHQNHLPAPKKIESTLKRTGYKKLLLHDANNSAKLLVPGMVVDLGGVAKGYIGDKMLEIMKSHGFNRCLIDAGGDLIIGDPPNSRNGWKIEVGGMSDSIIPALELSNCAVATSGDIEQYLEVDGKRYSHLIDPRTGIGIEGRRQATFVARSGMLADAYASTCLILGSANVGALLSDLSYFKLYILKMDGLSEQLKIFELQSSTSVDEL